MDQYVLIFESTKNIQIRLFKGQITIFIYLD